jgi:hypothetical protein
MHPALQQALISILALTPALSQREREEEGQWTMLAQRIAEGIIPAEDLFTP